jgi:hypothetical protein
MDYRVSLLDRWIAEGDQIEAGQHPAAELAASQCQHDSEESQYAWASGRVIVVAGG